MLGKKILVIEDEPTVLENIIELLESFEFSVLGAANGIIGIEYANSFLPDLIICDIIMPEMSGFDVISKLKTSQRTASIPFIFLTAKSEFADIRLGMNLGADDFLTKPFTYDELINSVKSRLDKFEIITNKSEEKLQDLRLKIASTVPHELRTPLNGIIASTQILIEYYDNMDTEEIKQLHRNIYNSSKRLQDLVVRYLFYSNLELLYYNPDRLKYISDYIVPFNSKDLISKIFTSVAYENKRENDLKFNLMDIRLNFAIEHIQNICNELITNAIKFSLCGTPIEISTHTEEGQFILIVKDYGRGMSNEQKNRIGAYIQFDRNIYEQQGSGLGLVIIQRITQIYNGSLVIDSDGKSYTEVKVTLPQNI
jgi:CheY-like chemotaxis protein/anti-sigma regulatory factor (Ser/Thr protein kinase)